MSPEMVTSLYVTCFVEEKVHKSQPLSFFLGYRTCFVDCIKANTEKEKLAYIFVSTGSYLCELKS